MLQVYIISLCLSFIIHAVYHSNHLLFRNNVTKKLIGSSI